MNVHFDFTSTTRFDQLKPGDVFLAYGKHPYIKIEQVVQPDVQWALGEISDFDYNAVALAGNKPGELELFADSDLVFPCPNASIHF